MKSAAIVAFAAAAMVAPALAQDAASLAALLPSCAVGILSSSKLFKIAETYPTGQLCLGRYSCHWLYRH